MLLVWLLSHMGSHRTGLKPVPWTSVVIVGILGRTLQRVFLNQPEPIQILATYWHNLGTYFSRPWYCRERIVNVILIENVKPPRCLKLAGECTCKVSEGELLVQLLGHAFNDHNFCVHSAAAIFFFAHILSFTAFYPADCFYSVSDPSQCLHIRISDISSLR